MRPVLTPDAPAPAGHYSQAVVHEGTAYVSGILPIAPDGTKVQGPLEEQLARVLANLDAVLRAAGSSRERVLRCTVYVADVALWPRVNAAYAAFFGAHKPARTVVPCSGLHYGFLVELDAIAAVDES